MDQSHRTNVANIFTKLAEASTGEEYAVYSYFADAFNNGQRDLDAIFEDAKDIALSVNKTRARAGKAANELILFTRNAGVLHESR